MIRRFTSVDEVRHALGEQFGPTEPLTISQERIDAFADVTGDDQWIHVDAARAAQSPYGATIAHGFLTLSLIGYFARQLYRLDFGDTRINYGLDRVRFPSAVPVGSLLEARSTFKDVEKSAAGTRITIHYELQAQGAARPACVADFLVLVA